MMLQDSIAQGSALQQEFNYRVDQELAARRQIPLLFIEMIGLLNNCQEKVRGRETAHCGSVPPSTFEAEPNPTPSHLIGTCPVTPETAQKPTLANHPAQNRLQTPQYQAYYPILAPPVAGYGFQQFYQPMVHTGYQPQPAAREASAEIPPDGPQMYVMQPAPQLFAMPQDASQGVNGSGRPETEPRPVGFWVGFGHILKEIDKTQTRPNLTCKIVGSGLGSLFPNWVSLRPDYDASNSQVGGFWRLRGRVDPRPEPTQHGPDV
ncbi:hypothetical protein PTTG_29364 [Puccinia triticina 1-1 BBBD Race 1]|uniref:Uncharacterized protein n=1 Tax=Puccinia triticina (isolate 1-1 / race 1 (BBBD)) TaxID=630390 RepID=A0A180G4I5_PUCT1|nr:hypothetical protein PTTG_29364 [Puccinia triticina 1-1 BBBD Race 1]